MEALPQRAQPYTPQRFKNGVRAFTISPAAHEASSNSNVKNWPPNTIQNSYPAHPTQLMARFSIQGTCSIL